METDFILMALVIFLPAAFGLTLCLIPSKCVEWMRWWALIGSTATVIVSLCMLIDFYAMLDSRQDENGRPLHSKLTLLEARSDKALSADAAPAPGPRMENDFIVRFPWIPIFNIHFALGVDGLSMAMVLLTTIVSFLALVASWAITEKVRGYLVLVLVLQTGVTGAFLAIDFFLFYVFYELMLIPMYFLIGIWGGERRKGAALKFVIYTLFGSVCILIAMVILYLTNVSDFVPSEVIQAELEQVQREQPGASAESIRNQTAIHSFDIITLQKAGRAAALHLTGQTARITDAQGVKTDPTNVPLLGLSGDRDGLTQRLTQPFFRPWMQYLLFILLFVGFAIKVPLVPFHSWLPDAHVQAPTPISMLLAGVLLKLGGYGLIRFAYPICPYAAYNLAWWIALLAVISILYGALLAMGQSDFKKLLAYSSISHMGYVVLGIAVWSGAGSQYWSMGMNGAVFQMIAHGITSSAMFFIVGVLYERAHHREMSRFGGVMEPMPLFGGMSAILFFATMGLPGLCGFVGELFVLMAAWHFSPWMAAIAIVTTILTAGYLLWKWQRVYLGNNPVTKEYPDLKLREILILVPFVIFAILLGVAPTPLVFAWLEPTITGLVLQLSYLQPLP